MAKSIVLSAIVLLAAAACDTSSLINADTGKDAIAGAAVGAGLAHLAETDVGTGAAVGAVAGTVAGVVTN